VIASAPGKVMLFGEYGVLEGGPAVLAAINRRATVRLVPSDRYQVDTCGWLPAPVSFEFSANGPAPVWQDAEDGHRLALFSTIAGHFPRPTSPVKIRMDTSAFFDGSSKLGIGSSAALCVALAAAWSGIFGRSVSLRQCQELHAQFQGSGSGADVIACYSGGLVCFSRSSPRKPACLPSGLHLKLVWTGLSASTSSMLEQLAAYRKSHSQAYLAAVNALVNTAATASRQVRASEWIAAVREFANALQGFARQTGLSIFRSPHRELADLAGQQGVLYKPVGAGGGDLGLVASEDAELLQSFCRQITARGMSLMDFEIDQQGLFVDNCWLSNKELAEEALQQDD